MTGSDAKCKKIGVNKMVNELSPQEEAAYELLITDKVSVRDASKKLEEKGYAMTTRQLVTFKKNLFDKILKEEREEHQAEYLLESFERTKIEFEDVVKYTKEAFEKVKKTDDPWKEAAILRQWQELLNTALRVQGRFETTLMKIQAKNVNILSPPDMAQAFKIMQDSWFSNMGAELKDGELVLTKPSPELVDDFNRWQAKELRVAERLDVLNVDNTKK